MDIPVSPSHSMTHLKLMALPLQIIFTIQLWQKKVVEKMVDPL
jgi:hypothetical protein